MLIHVSVRGGPARHAHPAAQHLERQLNLHSCLDVDTKDATSATLLHMGAADGDERIVNILLDTGLVVRV